MLINYPSSLDEYVLEGSLMSLWKDLSHRKDAGAKEVDKKLLFIALVFFFVW